MSSGRACAFDFSPPDRLKALSHDFTSIHTALHARIIHAYFYQNPFAIDDKRLDPRQLRDNSRLTPRRTTPPSAQGLHAHLFIVLQKNARSLNSSERFQELTHEVEGCRCDAILISETWRANNAEIWETQQGNMFMGSGKFENKHGVGILADKKCECISTGQTTSVNVPYHRRSQSTNNMFC